MTYCLFSHGAIWSLENSEQPLACAAGGRDEASKPLADFCLPKTKGKEFTLQVPPRPPSNNPETIWLITCGPRRGPQRPSNTGRLKTDASGSPKTVLTTISLTDCGRCHMGRTGPPWPPLWVPPRGLVLPSCPMKAHTWTLLGTELHPLFQDYTITNCTETHGLACPVRSPTWVRKLLLPLSIPPEGQLTFTEGCRHTQRHTEIRLIQAQKLPGKWPLAQEGDAAAGNSVQSDTGGGSCSPCFIKGLL